jgi:hypothetical protein
LNSTTWGYSLKMLGTQNGGENALQLSIGPPAY